MGWVCCAGRGYVGLFVQFDEGAGQKNVDLRGFGTRHLKCSRICSLFQAGRWSSGC